MILLAKATADVVDVAGKMGEAQKALLEAAKQKEIN